MEPLSGASQGEPVVAGGCWEAVFGLGCLSGLFQWDSRW